jgi:hypothetical protein
MSLEVWSTRETSRPEFTRAWERRLAASPLSHFGMRLDYLAWRARHGEHAIAALVDDGFAGALVLRQEHGAWTCGWPWRWQMVVEGGHGAMGLDPVETSAMARIAERLVPRSRLELFAPGEVPADWPGFKAGSTLVLDLTAPEETLWKGLDKSKQSSIRKAGRDGLQVVVAERPDQFRAFARLQAETEARRRPGAAPPAQTRAAEDGDSPAPGEGWREWELPWHWLLVAERDGVVEAGSGFGFAPGGMLDYRTNASSTAGKKAGANFLLAWEAIRRGRELGYRRMNWGGVTRFKRDMRGEQVEVFCGLGGGAAWRIPNQLRASVRRARPRLAAWWRSVRDRRTGGANG